MSKGLKLNCSEYFFFSTVSCKYLDLAWTVIYNFCCSTWLQFEPKLLYKPLLFNQNIYDTSVTCSLISFYFSPLLHTSYGMKYIH